MAGTGTLFGGKSSDIYFLLFRLLGSHMVKSGFSYKEVSSFIEQYGNVEETSFVPKDDGSTKYSNKASRGSNQGPSKRKKEVPGYTPLIYPAFLLEHVVNVRLKDVWPNPVEFIDTPTIFVEPTNEQKAVYDQMIKTFEHEIDSREDGYKLYTQMIDYGFGYLDNPVQFPSAYYNNAAEGVQELIWQAEHLDADQTFPKEQKLQEIVEREMVENRPCIVYVRDTGSSKAERDVRPRLKMKLEEIGAKVCILDSNTVATNKRSEWLEQKIVNEGFDVCIVSQELVKVGLDLLCTPTLIYYQFSWSLYTLQQSARRAFRIGQTEECRNFYLAYANSYQEYVANLVARKLKSAAAINGEASSEGISQMLGDDGDLQSILLKSTKEGTVSISGGAEEWIAEASERSRELLENLNKPILKERIKNKETAAKESTSLFDTLNDVSSNTYDIEDMSVEEALEVVEYCTVSAVISEYKAEIKTVSELQNSTKKVRKNKKVSDDQLVFDLFAV